MTVTREGHASHAQYLILHADLPVFAPRDVALIAQIVRYHRKENPSLDMLRPLTRKGDDRLVARCALLLRVAEQLDTGEDGRVEQASFTARRRELLLELGGDDRLARWSLERQLDGEQFRRAFGRRLEISPRGGR